MFHEEPLISMEREIIFIVGNGSLNYSNVLHPKNGSFFFRTVDRDFFFWEPKWFFYVASLRKLPFGTFTFGALNMCWSFIFLEMRNSGNIERYTEKTSFGDKELCESGQNVG